jgi:hypothetical protein
VSEQHPPTPADLARDLEADLALATNLAARPIKLSGGAGSYHFPLVEVNWINQARFGWAAALRLAIAYRAERDKLQRFKDWTHNYLDGVGVPHHPPGSHGAEGCRIGDRMDWLMARLRGAESEATALRERVRHLGAELDRLEDEAGRADERHRIALDKEFDERFDATGHADGSD